MNARVRGEADAIQVVTEGRLVRSGQRIAEASSTVTLVKSSGQLVIVDTGSSDDRDDLEKALERLSVRPEKVNTVVNTHLHLDHCGCNDLFTKARFYAHRLEDPPLGTIRVSGTLDLLPGVVLLHTPGHTAGSISVLVEADRRYAVCGDAIPTWANLEMHVPPAINVNPRQALASMKVLEAFADIVVPGHEGPFEVRPGSNMAKLPNQWS